MIAWDPRVPADALFAADWLEWVRSDKVVSTEAVAGRDVERLVQEGSSVSYLLAVGVNTAVLIADIGGGPTVVEPLISPLVP